MKPLYLYGLVLLLTFSGLALAGIVLMRVKWMRARHINSYTRVATLVLLALAYALSRQPWPGVHLREVDLWALLVILGILGYSLLAAALRYAQVAEHDEDFSKSYMLSMLYRDSEQLAEADLLALEKESAKRKRAS